MSFFLGLMRYLAKIGLLSIMFTVFGCNTLKRVGDADLLLTKNSIYADEDKISNDDIKSLLIQKPNSSLLGYPLRLNLYNLAKENPDSSFYAWLHKKEKREKRLNRLLSEKQVNRLRESFLVKGASDFFKRIGEPPVIIDSSLAQKSVDRLKAYYGSKGYFNNSGTYTINAGKRKKRAEINYRISLEKPFMIDTIATNIVSTELDSIYKVAADLSFVKDGEQFDLANFNRERERLTVLFRNSGVYNFQESSINYDIERDTSQVADDQLMAVQLNIEKPRNAGDSLAIDNYRVHRLKKINIYTDYFDRNQTDSLKSLDYEDYTIFYTNKLKYKPKALTDAIFFEKDSIYRDLDRIRTYRQITNLNTFKYPNIGFEQDTIQQGQLISNIYLAPRSKFSLNLDFDVTHSNIQQVGTAFSTTLITRNVFGGAETLNISARGSIGLLSDASLSDETFTSELGGDINITFPRIWFPFKTEKIIPYYMLPQSRFLVGTNFQRNIGLDKQTFNTILSYNWSPTNSLKHAVELLNVEFVRNVNPNNFFNVYQNTYSNLNDIAQDYLGTTGLETFFNDDQDLIIPDGANGFIDYILDGNELSDDDLSDVGSIMERRDRLTENNLIFASNYTFNKNSRVDITDNDFYQFRLKLESAGNLLSLLDGMVPYNKNEDDQLLVFSVPFSQYFKTEFDFIRHWELATSKVLAFRSFFGLAVPYGNSESIPFVRSYFAGGSNDNRAWNAYELGPGSTDNVNDFNEANLKIALNLEYRFPIAGDVKGALFADVGNIWNVFDNEDNPDAIFSGLDSLSDIALGTGFGLRYDFTYFVFRLDVGFKTYNPAEEPQKRWFRDYNFRNSVFNIGINYPF